MNDLLYPALCTPSDRPLRVGMLGMGVVGRGTHRLIARNRRVIRAHAGRDVELVMLTARNLARARSLAGPGVAVVADPKSLVRDPAIDVVVEVIGGCDVARELVLEAIAHGKHVVTANKALLARHGDEIFARAKEKGVTVAFEGAVAVSIPIVKALREGLAANEVEWVAGIINGTSNFILSRMTASGVGFEDAVREAQSAGFAEADPGLDIDGVDAAHKLALLASMAFGMPVRFDGVRVEGIRAVHPFDLRSAQAAAQTVKLMGLARRSPAGVELRVGPVLLPTASLMAQVGGAMNAIMVKSDAAGVSMYYGAGAGSDETASAVVADLIDIARLTGASPAHAVPPLGFHGETLRPQEIVTNDAVPAAHYVRIAVDRGAAGQSLLADALARQGIGVERAFAAGPDESIDGRRLQAVITHPAPESSIGRALAALAPGATSAPVCWRLESFG